MRNINKIEAPIVDDVKLVRFRLNGGWDYVWMTYHPTKGFISITSSFGNYSYIWSSMGKGVELQDFFSRADKYYLAEKLFSDSKREKKVFSASDAYEDIKKELFGFLRRGHVSPQDARLIYDELCESEEDFDADSSADLFMNEIFSLKHFIEWQPEPYHSSYGYRTSGSYITLQEELVPLIQDYFKSLVNKKENIQNDGY